MRAGCRRLALLALLHSLPLWQSLAFRRVRNEEAHKEVVGSEPIDWDSYSDTLDNGIDAVLAIKDAAFPSDKADTFGAFRGLVSAAVPFMPPPFGMAVGGAMSLMSGIFGWGGGMSLEDLSAQISQGFAKVTAKLDTIIEKLDLMQAAINRIEDMTAEILGTVTDIQQYLDMTGIRTVHAEYRVVMDAMATMERFPADRDRLMRNMFGNVSLRRGDIAMLVRRDFGAGNVERVINSVYAQNGNNGKCQAREFLDEIVATRFEAYYLLFLADVFGANCGYTCVFQPEASALTNALRADMDGYKAIRTRFQAKPDPWDWSAEVTGNRGDCGSCTGNTCRISSNGNSSFSYKPEDECARDSNCVGFVKSWSRITRPLSYPPYYTWRTIYSNTFYRTGQCFRPLQDHECTEYGCARYRKKVQRNCWA